MDIASNVEIPPMVSHVETHVFLQHLTIITGTIKGMAVSSIISLVNALGYSGILLGPVVIGFVAKNYGLHTSFAGISVFCLVMGLVSWNILKPKSKRIAS